MLIKTNFQTYTNDLVKKLLRLKVDLLQKDKTKTKNIV